MWTDATLDEAAATSSLRAVWTQVYAQDHDPTGLRSERNILRYHPLSGVAVLAGPDTTEAERAIVDEAARVSGTPLHWFTDADELISRLPALGVERVRVLGPVNEDVHTAAHSATIAVDTAPVTSDGVLELAHWVKEQAVSITRHRHGRLLGNAH